MLTAIDFSAEIVAHDTEPTGQPQPDGRAEYIHGDIRFHRPQAWNVNGKQLVHIRARHMEEGIFFTQLGFWVLEEHVTAFPVGEEIQLNNMVIRCMSYPLGNTYVTVNRTQSLELLYNGHDPLQGIDYYDQAAAQQNRSGYNRNQRFTGQYPPQRQQAEVETPKPKEAPELVWITEKLPE